MTKRSKLPPTLIYILPLLVLFSLHIQIVKVVKKINMATLGGVTDTAGAENSLEVEQLGRFAVDEHNEKENALLQFTKVVKAKEQVVAGTLHHLTLEVLEGGQKALYEAKVWVKPWMDFKEVQEFKKVE